MRRIAGTLLCFAICFVVCLAACHEDFEEPAPLDLYKQVETFGFDLSAVTTPTDLAVADLSVTESHPDLSQHDAN